MLNFYESKAKTLPRFFYRNFLDHIKFLKINNTDAIELFKESILNLKGADFLKFT